jgi:ABC-2 type transport system ATP-binding protein
VAAPIIELVDLTKKYGDFTAVDQLCLTIQKGEIFGLLGPNGAGKSTTILMMLGLTEPTSGTVNVCGINSTSNPIEVKRKVGYLPEDVGFYDDRTALENLMYTALLNRIPEATARENALDLLHRVGLSEIDKKKVGTFSRGMRQRLGLADVLIKKPEVIILDEPTSGIDPAGVREFLELISSLRKEEGITVLFSSHNLHQVQQACDRVGIFVNGKLLAEGDIGSLSKKLFTADLYLIEAGVQSSSSSSLSVEWMTKILQPLEGIGSVEIKNGIFQIVCSRDISPDIARAVVNSGASLTYLNRKEYGLDDIYYRYFEGGLTHE